jgi:hypothetical protein
LIWLPLPLALAIIYIKKTGGLEIL